MANVSFSYKKGRISAATGKGRPTLNISYFTEKLERLELMTYDGRKINVIDDNLQRGNLSCQDLVAVLGYIRHGIVGSGYHQNFDRQAKGLAADALRELKKSSVDDKVSPLA
jgi:hypothetical protein